MLSLLRSLLCASALALLPPLAAPASATPAATQADDILALSRAALFGPEPDRRAALDRLVARGDPDVIPSLVLLLRIGGDDIFVAQALSTLAGEEIRTWREGMLFQERRPDIRPHSSYAALKLWYWSGIDPRFRDFFDHPDAPTPGRTPLRIRFEEITWGGVQVDGIPSLDHPDQIPAEDAAYLFDDDLVFGIEINGDARAYPLRIMDWHEMFNDVIGGVPVALAYCTLCGAGILFETQTEGRGAPFVFGSSGLLYRSNKLMFDRETLSLWNQFTGEPVTGPLAQSGITLPLRPVEITAWADWRARHPDTTVLALETGHIRDYDPGVAYRDYYASPDLMFPTRTNGARLPPKTLVFGVRGPGGAKAWPLDAFDGGRVINDQVGFETVTLLGDGARRSVRAYRRDGRHFEATADAHQLKSDDGALWRVTETALIGPDALQLPRLAGHVAYWFAWDGFLGVESALYDATDP